MKMSQFENRPDQTEQHLADFVVSIDGQDGGMLLLNSFAGTTVYLGADEVDRLQKDGSIAYDTHKMLVANQMTCTEPGMDRQRFEQICDSNRRDDEQRNSFRIGFLLDELQHQHQLDAAIEAAQSEISSRISGKLFLHFWAFSKEVFGRIPEVVDRLSSDNGDLQYDLSISLDASFGIDDEIELALEKCVEHFDGAAQLVFSLHQSALETCGGSQEYARSVFLWQSLFFRYNFTPAFILLVGPDDETSIAQQFYEDLCFSGVYPRNIHMAFVNAGPNQSSLGCEVYGRHSIRQSSDILSKPTHQLIEPFALGYADAIRTVITRNALWPRTFHCPYTRPTLLFAGDFAGACPVALSRAATGDKAVLPMLMNVEELDSGKRKHWQKRGPHSISACRSCRSAPLCGSGCPLASFEKSSSIDEPDCPPIPEINEYMSGLVSPGNLESIQD